MAVVLRSLIPSLDQLDRWAQGIKSASVTVLASGAAAIAGIGTFNAVTSNSVSVEPLKVPAPFEEQGFNSDIATARLLDEIATYGRQQSSAKERVSILSKNQHDDLQRLQMASAAGVDIQRFEGIVRDVLGIQKQTITGEITFKKEGDSIAYQVRMRRLPGNQVLIDLTAKGDPQAVLKKTALAMIEVFDPHIAASVYYRDKDEDNALRMIDVVLNNERKDDDKYSLNLRGYINITRGNYGAAKADFERIMSIDPKFAPAHSMASWFHLEKKEFDSALAEADLTIEYAPDKWWGYAAKARALRDMKRTDEAAVAFSKMLSLNPDSLPPYIQAGVFFLNIEKAAEAETAVRKGVTRYPENPRLRALLGDILAKQGDNDRARREYENTLRIDANNPYGLIGLFESNQASGRTELLRELSPQLERALASIKDSDKKLASRIQNALASLRQ